MNKQPPLIVVLSILAL